MIAVGNFHKITLPGSHNSLQTYNECMAQVMCNTPAKSCFLNECEYRSKIDDLKKALRGCLEKVVVENITYIQWIVVHC